MELIKIATSVDIAIYYLLSSLGSLAPNEFIRYLNFFTYKKVDIFYFNY